MEIVLAAVSGAVGSVATAVLSRLLPRRRARIQLPTGAVIRDRRSRSDRRVVPMVIRARDERRSGDDRRQRVPVFVPA